jgi:hypothetical protein
MPFFVGTIERKKGQSAGVINNANNIVKHIAFRCVFSCGCRHINRRETKFKVKSASPLCQLCSPSIFSLLFVPLLLASADPYGTETEKGKFITIMGYIHFNKTNYAE